MDPAVVGSKSPALTQHCIHDVGEIISPGLLGVEEPNGAKMEII